MWMRFPEKSWKEEFYIANSIGFNLIEWIIDEDLNNPIFNSLVFEIALVLK